MEIVECGDITFVELMSPSEKFMSVTLARDFTVDNHKTWTLGYAGSGGDMTKIANHNSIQMIVRKNIVRMKREIPCHDKVT